MKWKKMEEFENVHEAAEYYRQLWDEDFKAAPDKMICDIARFAQYLMEQTETVGEAFKVFKMGVSIRYLFKSGFMFGLFDITKNAGPLNFIMKEFKAPVKEQEEDEETIH